MNAMNGGSKKFRIAPKHERILAVIAVLNLATTTQINRALYSAGSRATTEIYLHTLEKERYLERTYWRRFDRGNPLSVWKLSGRGMRYAKAHGLAPKDVIRPSDNTTHARGNLSHSLRVGDILVHALELARKDSQLEVHCASEPTLRRHPLTVGTGLNKVVIYPDAMLRLIKHRPGEEDGEMCFAYELTRTTDLERVKLKMANWLQADSGQEWEQLSGTELLQVIWVADEGNITKRDQLAAACFDHLTETHQLDQADLFLFGTTTDETTAAEFFFDPQRFVRPSGEPTALLPMSWWSRAFS